MRSPTLVVLMGIDGAGKTTQAELLQQALDKRGFRTQYSHWIKRSFVTKVAKTFTRVAPGLTIHSHRLPQSKGQIGKSTNRYSSKFLFIRFGMIFIDLVLFHIKLAFRGLNNSDQILILDRYIYDDLVHLSYLGISDTLIRSSMCLIPVPKFLFWLDIDPRTALERKREHPFTYLDAKNQRYQKIMSALHQKSESGSTRVHALNCDNRSSAEISSEIADFILACYQ